MEKSPLTTPVQFVKGVGPYIAGLLEKRDVRTVSDLLYYFPFKYLDRRQIDTSRTLQNGPNKSFVGEVVGVGSRPMGRNFRRKIYEMVLKDQTGLVLVVWFNGNEKYLKKQYPIGKKLLVFGECQYYKNHKQFTHPEISEWDEEEGAALPPIIPVYPLTEGLYQKTIRKIIFHTLDQYLKDIDDTNITVRASGESKVGLHESILHLHKPPADASIDELNNKKTIWHQRVIYDELFFLQLGLALKKRGYQKEYAEPLIATSKQMVQKALGLAPFKLTGAQERVVSEIFHDLSKNHPANRLVQGDVGSGKTFVAFLSLLRAVENGAQGVLMAPTEVLAGQHFKNLEPLALQLGISLKLLMGSTSKSEKEMIYQNIQLGKVDIVIGTHALIQDDVTFKNLGLVVIDEQHRFGVRQRLALKNKGKNDKIVPHILVMTATPIPRTLSMTLYGDLDVSIIDEMPQGRKPIKTYVYNEKMRERAYDLIRKELDKKHQAYFVYPLIEESEKIDLKNAQTMCVHLKDVFQSYAVELLHGKMSADEKDEIMARFKKGEIHILVSTTVIEVGVDVPNATVMVIEHAERFGLSQLHQLRGRVGRGGHQGYCLLLAGYKRSEEARFRLKVMEDTNDGFVISEEDLKIRGPGDFLGTRQAGMPELRLANLVTDTKLLAAARNRALEIVEENPTLDKPDYSILKKILKDRWEGKLALADVS
ncbi:ATP-dependent DNA helicase RecG [bacterium]|nr:ATP-dependent DNA helicase RecG [bacterium]